MAKSTLFILLAVCIGLALCQEGANHVFSCSSSASSVISDEAGVFGCETYTNEMTRTWLFQPPGNDGNAQSERILIQWETFDTENGYDFVRLYDGQNNDADLLGSYSGGTTPPDVISSGPYLYVEFISDQYVTGGGFTAQYSRQFQGSDVLPCSSSQQHHLTDSEGTFGCESYANGITTSWHIEDGTADQIVISFNFIDTEQDYDVVKIYDGPDTNSPLIGTYSGNMVPPPVTTSTGVAHVTFTSDYSINSAGFSAHYESLVSAVDACFRSAHEDIHQHNGFVGCADGYGNNVDSSWTITAVTGHVIRLDFLTLSTESGYDYVRVYDGGDDSAPLVGSYSGSVLPPVAVSTSNQLTLTFHSDASVRGDGFSAEFITIEAVDGMCFSDGQYVFTQPMGSLGCNTYGPNVGVTWQLVAQEGNPNQVINLSFDTFDLETNDWVRIYDGSSAAGPLLAEYNGTSTSPQGALSTGRDMFVSFTSDNTGEGSGFSAVYQSIAPVASNTNCAGSASYFLSAPSDVFGCDGYGDNVVVTWAITVAESDTLLLTFTSFYTEASYDYVRVYDGPTTSYDMLGQYSGSDIPAPAASSGNTILVVFSSDSSVHRLGFSAEYQSVQGQHGSSDCYNSGDVPAFTDPQGTFGCDGYGNSVTKTWRIEPSAAGNIMLSFDQFATEHNYDFVTVYDGTSTSSTVLGRLSGNGIPDPILSTGNALTVVLTSDSSVNYAGFSASYYVVAEQSSCTYSNSQVIDDATEGSFGCDGYGNSIDSSWLLVAPEGRKLAFSFAVLDTEAYYDYVRIYDGPNSDAVRLGSFSGTELPGPVTTTDNEAYVTFHSDSSVSADYAGFTIDYATFGTALENCDVSEQTNLSSSSGSLGCDGYHNQITRTWVINPGHGCVLLSFSTMDTEQDYDIVTVYDGSNTLAHPLGTYSGTTIPRPIKSSGSSMTVSFVSDYSVNAGGFSATYQTVNC